jgi:hypothetical protein
MPNAGHQIAWVLTTDKAASNPSLAKCRGEGEAAHYMAGTYYKRRIGANDDILQLSSTV